MPRRHLCEWSLQIITLQSRESPFTHSRSSLAAQLPCCYTLLFLSQTACPRLIAGQIRSWTANQFTTVFGTRRVGEWKQPSSTDRRRVYVLYTSKKKGWRTATARLGGAAISTKLTRPNDPSGRMSRGEAPERAGGVLVFVRFGSLGRVDAVETARYPSDWVLCVRGRGSQTTRRGMSCAMKI